MNDGHLKEWTEGQTKSRRKSKTKEQQKKTKKAKEHQTKMKEQQKKSKTQEQQKKTNMMRMMEQKPSWTEAEQNSNVRNQQSPLCWMRLFGEQRHSYFRSHFSTVLLLVRSATSHPQVALLLWSS